jgi:hypothetical protein
LHCCWRNGGTFKLHARQRSAEDPITEAMMMRKLMTTMLGAAILAGLTIGMVGCTEETGTKEKVEIKTPGGTATESREIKVNKSGDNPPLAPSEKDKP